MSSTFPVLVCDDSLIARKQVARYFKNHNDFVVSQAQNGQVALDLLRQQEFGLLCLDLTMPVMDGLGVLANLKAEKIHLHTIIISADIQPEMKQRVAEFGVLGFIEKPFKDEAFSSLLHKFGIR
ncbi:response regulator [Pseudoalteromonas sp. T1lg24]|uniref:response regulator n=1 Tax=Pseudoalteromonas sp. T1lg24 TaxID=2077099 RepID=UPI001F4332AE|nr:response regulator [Pseudoalteromonas sp. T1lg24]